MTVAARVATLARSAAARNAAALYGLGFAAYLFPLVTAPYLARVLQPAGWGRVALAQSLGQSLAVLVEYGFVLSATREVARAAPAARGDLLASVLGAKAVLAGCVLALAAVVHGAVPALAADPRLFWSAVLWAIGQGLHPLWYWQGRERVRPILVLDLAATALAIAGVLVFCREAGDAWKVVALQAGAAGLVAIVGHARAFAETGFRLPSVGGVVRRLADGASLSAYRIAVAGYTLANPLLLGALAPAAAVGYFAAAEKIVKTLFVIAIHPLNQALYPRASRNRLGTRALVAFAAAGTVAGLAVLVTAPVLARVIFGPDFAPATPVLRVLALLLPILSISTALVMQRMLPEGRDRALLAITLTAVVLNVVLAIVLAPRFGAIGMAAAVVAVESVVLVAIGVATRGRA